MDPILTIKKKGEQNELCVSAATMLAVLIQEVQNANGGHCIVGDFEFGFRERHAAAHNTEAQTPSQK